jgi:hypothetical protein
MCVPEYLPEYLVPGMLSSGSAYIPECYPRSVFFVCYLIFRGMLSLSNGVSSRAGLLYLVELRVTALSGHSEASHGP